MISPRGIGLQAVSSNVKLTSSTKSLSRAKHGEKVSITRADLRSKVIALGTATARPNVNKVRELHTVEIRCKKTKELVDLEVFCIYINTFIFFIYLHIYLLFA